MWGSGQSQARSQADNEMFHDQQHQDSFKIRLGQHVADKMNQNIFGQVMNIHLIVIVKESYKLTFKGL